MVKPLSMIMLKFLNEKDTDAQTGVSVQTSQSIEPVASFAKIPGTEYKYIGKRKPLPSTVLLILNATAKTKYAFAFASADMLDSLKMLKKRYFHTQRTMSSRLELWKHMLDSCIAVPHCMCNNYSKICSFAGKLYTLEITAHAPALQFLLIELVCCKLIRFSRYNYKSLLIIRHFGQNKLFSVLVEMMKFLSILNKDLATHRLYVLVENAIVRHLSIVNDIGWLYKIVWLHREHLQSLGESFKRNVVHALARVIRTSGVLSVPERTQVDDMIKILLEKYPELATSAVFAKHTAAMFPQPLNKHFCIVTQNSYLRDISKAMIDNESQGLAILQSSSKTASASVNALVTRYQANASKHILIFLAWKLIAQEKSSFDDICAGVLKQVMNSISTGLDYNTTMFKFVNYIVDIYLGSQASDAMIAQVCNCTFANISIFTDWRLSFNHHLAIWSRIVSNCNVGACRSCARPPSTKTCRTFTIQE